MAASKQEYNALPSTIDVEMLIDMFLDDQLNIDYSKTDKRFLFGETRSDGKVDYEETFDAQKVDATGLKNESRNVMQIQIGRSYAQAGDELWRSHHGPITPDDLQAKLLSMAESHSGQVLSPEEEARHWHDFKEIVEKAVEGTGADDAYKVTAAILVAIKGLSHFGVAVRTLARHFLIQYFDEHHIKVKADIERIARKIKSTTDEELD